MGRYRRRLRMTCESALRVAEWRLAQQERRILLRESKSERPAVAARPSFGQLSVLWLVVALLVLGAIALASRWAKPIEVDVGLWLVVLGAAALIVAVVLALTARRWKPRRGGS